MDRIISSLLQNENGQPLTLRAVDEEQGLDWSYTLLSSLNEMPNFIEERVHAYRIGQLTFHDFLVETIPYIRDTLVLLSNTAARYMNTGLWQGIVDRIEDTEAYRCLLKEHLAIILNLLDESEILSDKPVASLADAVEGIFLNCGLGFSTHSEGLYISVAPPSL